MTPQEYRRTPEYRRRRADYMRGWRNRWLEIDPAKIKRNARRAALKRRYGITPEQYDEILARQGGKCAICGNGNPQTNRPSRFHVDHCHETGHIRGLLCIKCNHALGRFGDSVEGVERVLKYLRGASGGV